MAVVAPRTTIEIASSICLYGKVSVTASTLSWVKWPREQESQIYTMIMQFYYWLVSYYMH